ncbi:thioredoxin domain-containing protein [Spirillospora sp. NPDC029432]|uniref:DsbA family protein n=1 Tax=Spirillospora sp. NPDC029432 TaxID=3154599 RepID=UPI003453B808
MTTSRWDRRGPGEAGRRLLAVLGAVAVFSVTVGAFTLLRRPAETGTAATTGSYDAPVSTVWRAADGSVAVAGGGVRWPLLEIYTDYRCATCAEMEDVTGATIKRLASQGRVRAVYRPVAFETAEPAASATRRAANASLCAPAGHWLAYHGALFTRGPMEGAGGFTAADLVALARDTGIADPAFGGCVTGGLQSARLDRLTQEARDARGVHEVPAAFLNGTRLDLQDHLLSPARLERAVHTAVRP